VTDIVVDASVSVKWINRTEADADKAGQIWEVYEQGRISFVLPVFWDYEVVNVINRAVNRGDLSEEEGKEAVALLLAVQAEKVPLPSGQESYNLARRYRRSVYDSFYLSLAEARGYLFYTADERLYNAVKDNLSFVRWLRYYSAA